MMGETFPNSERSNDRNIEIVNRNIERLSQGDQKFAHSIMTTYNNRQALSEKQWFWLDQLATRAINSISDHGKRTGRCQICSRKLVAPKSLKVGYGPVCAYRNGLPYGE